MLVRDHMSSKVITVQPTTPLGTARNLLKKHRIRQLPVVRDGRLAGIVTDRDLRSAAAGRQTVSQVMTAKPVVVAPGAPIDEAAQLLRTLKVGALPVVENKKVVGIVTAADLMDAFVEFCGVAEPTFHIVLAAADGPDVKWRIRRVIDRKHGDLKWIFKDRRSGKVHLRLKARDIDDTVAGLEAEGLEVNAILAPAHRRRA